MITLTHDEQAAVMLLVDRLARPTPTPEVQHALRTASSALSKATRWLDASTAHGLAGQRETATAALHVARSEAQRACLALDLATADAGVEEYVTSKVWIVGGGE